MSDDTIILRPYRRDDQAWLVERHQTLYGEAEGFDETFGALVDRILSDFVNTHDPSRERGWVAQRGAERLGSIFCVESDDKTAKLRLFLVDPVARGQGVGQHLLETCIAFARKSGYSRMSLWTHESHTQACALYARNGFSCLSSKPVHSFGQDLIEQSWEVAL